MATPNAELPLPMTAAEDHGAWAPLRVRLFRALWLAGIFSNVASIRRHLFGA